MNAKSTKVNQNLFSKKRLLQVFQVKSNAVKKQKTKVTHNEPVLPMAGKQRSFRPNQSLIEKLKAEDKNKKSNY